MFVIYNSAFPASYFTLHSTSGLYE